MNNSDRKDKIINSITQAKEKGYTLIYGEWGSPDNQCVCALGCVLVVEGKEIGGYDDRELIEAAQALEASEDWAASFIDGFDNNGTGEFATDPEAWKLGYEIRQTTLPTEYGEWLEKNNYD
jgi:hypothetical protein